MICSRFLMRKLNYFILSIIWGLTFGNHLVAQELVETTPDMHLCTMAGDHFIERYYVNRPEPKVEHIFDEICKKSLVNRSLFMVGSAQINTIHAYSDNLGNKRIHYQPAYINDLDAYFTKVFVFAHEIGHHQNDHLRIEVDSATRRDQELDADLFAGGTLARMEASRQDVERAVSIFSELGNGIYSPRSERLKAAIKGYDQVKSPHLFPPNEFSQTCTISFKNLTGKKIRIAKIIDNTWRDAKNQIEIAPNETNSLFKIPLGKTDFYIEISGGRENGNIKWQYHTILPKQLNDKQMSIDIK